jgi:hypothetical protein
MPNKFVDCDGHVMETTDEIIRLVGEPFKTTGHMNPRRILPGLDRFHTPRLEERKPGTFDPAVGPEKWLQFLDKMGLEFSALFPTEGRIDLPNGFEYKQAEMGNTVSAVIDPHTIMVAEIILRALQRSTSTAPGICKAT